MKVSIIIRTRNEERWIGSCLKAVFSQEFRDFEVIIVDNQSTDSTLAKVEQFPVAKVVHCTDYLPGKALNLGIAEATGEFIVCLSGHCIPVDNRWLGNLLRNFDDPQVAGVYGRQEPLSFTPPSDKRDLMIVFGPEKKIQRKDSFFHNANSMIRKSVLDQYPFDPTVTNIEDRVWARQVLDKGFVIVYEPEASVYHYHGIHQNGNEERCRNVVKILESLDKTKEKGEIVPFADDLEVVALIPVKGRAGTLAGRSLLECAISVARGSRYITKVVVTTDSERVHAEALLAGADLVIRRDESLSREYVGLEKVYQHALKELEAQGVFPDLLALLEVTYPFRSGVLIDNMVEKMVGEGLDTILPVRLESNAIWVEEEGDFKRIDDGFMPRQYKRPVYVSYKGLCCITRPSCVRAEEIVGPRLGFYKVDDAYAGLELRGDQDHPLPDLALERLVPFHSRSSIKPIGQVKKCGNG